MALIFDFDDSLNGHVEQVGVDLNTLPYPIFTFPKGSFFVSELYGVIRGTNKLVRPGIDYKVLSLNENIAFNDTDNNLNTKLQQNYVRNAILWHGDSSIIAVDWNVPYCGGEDETKPPQYQNLLDRLWATAVNNGTSNLFTTEFQAWGGYVDINNAQITSGRDIYTKYFDYYSDLNANGGLGWGKVKISMMALAEVVSNGGDPMILQAYYDWVRFNKKRFEDHSKGSIADLYQRIDNLDSVRVADKQFVFSNDHYNHYAKQHFLELNNVMLRGLDPNEQFVSDPVCTHRPDVGFYGLGVWGVDTALKSTRLSKRTESEAGKKWFTPTVSITGQDGLNINWSVEVTNRELATSNLYTLYFVSKQLGIIQAIPVTDFMKTGVAAKLNGSFRYPNDETDYADDIIFAYILDDQMRGNFENVGRFRYISKYRSYGYSMSYTTRGLVFSNGQSASKNASIDTSGLSGTSNIEITVNRRFGDYPETVYLTVGTLNKNDAVVVKQIDWLVGETSKTVNLTPQSDIFNQSKAVIISIQRDGTSTNTTKILASVVVGYRNTSNVNTAVIRMIDNYTATQESGLALNNSSHYLDIQFANNVNFSTIVPVLNTYLDSGATGTVTMGDLVYVSAGRMVAPITFSNFVKPLNQNYVTVGLELSGQGGSLSSNRLTVYVNENDVNLAGTNGFVLQNTIVNAVTNGVNITFKLTPRNKSVLPDLTPFKVTTDANLTVVNQPQYLNNILEYTLFFSNDVLNKEVVTTITYTNMSGIESQVGQVKYTNTSTTGNNIFVLDKKGKQLSQLSLNNPFKLIYSNGTGKAVKNVTTTLDTSRPERSTKVVFGNDAVATSDGMYNITKPTVPLNGAVVGQVSVDGWLSVSSISTTTASGSSLGNQGFIFLKTLVNYQDGTSEIFTTKLTVITQDFTLNFYDINKVFISNRNIQLGNDFFITVTSDIYDLSTVTRGVVGVNNTNLTIKNLMVDQANNIVTIALSTNNLPVSSGALNVELFGQNTIELSTSQTVNFINGG